MKHQTWMAVAQQIAKDSKCISMKVGCVLVKDGHIISTGVNGTPKGFHNCPEVHTERGVAHSEWSEKYEIHSELNAIGHCPVDTAGSVAYITHSPCFNCCKHMIAFGIREIRFDERYYRMTDEELHEVVVFCKKMKVELVHGETYLTRRIYGSMEPEPGLIGYTLRSDLDDSRSTA